MSNEMKDWLNERRELLARLQCALTHNIEVCDNCKLCGQTGAEVRINLINRLVNELGVEDK